MPCYLEGWLYRGEGGLSSAMLVSNAREVAKQRRQGCGNKLQRLSSNCHDDSYPKRNNPTTSDR
jgi:hypothetical protein